MSKGNIGIIGCGWLGFSLAKHLVNDGYTVYGSTTSLDKLDQLSEAGIIPFQVRISEDKIVGDVQALLSNVNILVVNVPPKLRGKGPKENYVKKMELLHTHLKKTAINKVIFISSTSVYGDIDGIVDEDTPPAPTTESGKQLLQSENILLNDENLKTTVIRFGGLIGPNRHPVTMLSRRENLKNGNAPINLIHLDDCIGIISKVIAMESPTNIYNAVYPYHPTKEVYYTQKALKRNIEPPHYQENNKKISGKIIICKYLSTNIYRFSTRI